MPLTPGTRLGSYLVEAVIGAGGMGEVYRARDTKLGRDVALKVVLDAFLSDRDRLARFEREAKALAALNHPHIATLHGMEELGGRHVLIMELVGGSTLAERLADGRLPLELAVAFASQIAEALEAAHEKGIVHRDLKPANIKITSDDVVKVLDFGLATAAKDANAGDAGVSFSLANSPTLTSLGTHAGMILGTASYMSPEQARGLAADHRSDVFAFGVVLYEMLTGRQPFQGDTVSDVLASVLAREPDPTELPPDLAPRLTDLLKRCLEKHPKRRWQAIGDVRLELETIAANPRKPAGASTGAAAVSVPVPPLWRRALPIAAAAVVAAAATAGVFVAARRAPQAPAVLRFAIPYREGQLRSVVARTALAISPDGTRVAYVADREIYVRTLSDAEPRLVGRSGSTSLTATPYSLVFSPDGRSLAYWDQADDRIKRIDLAGGAPVPICTTIAPTNISWQGDDLYFAVQGRLARVHASGGAPETVVQADPDAFLTAPQVLGDGRLLFSMAPPSDSAEDRWTRARIVLQRPGDEKQTTLVDGGSDPHYLPSGHLVYQSGGVLFARTFDPRTGALGAAASVVDGVLRGASNIGAGLGWYSASPNGTLVYLPGPVGPIGQDNRIGWFDREGNARYLPIPSGPYLYPRVSRDGKHIAFTRADGRETSIWVYDLSGGAAARRLTFGSRDRYATWSADSQWVIFQPDQGTQGGLYRQRADGTGSAERLTTAAKPASHVPSAVSPDGSVLLFDQVVDQGGERIATLMTYAFKDRTVTPYGGVTSRTITGAEFSPDGRWVAYSAHDAGQGSNMTYVQPYPATGTKYQISSVSEDGHQQVWSADGRELFYTPGPGARLNAVRVQTTPSFAFGPGDPVARPFTNAPPQDPRTFDVGREGVQFLGLAAAAADTTSARRNEIQVVVNWMEELKSRVR